MNLIDAIKKNAGVKNLKESIATQPIQQQQPGQVVKTNPGQIQPAQIKPRPEQIKQQQDIDAFYKEKAQQVIKELNPPNLSEIERRKRYDTIIQQWMAKNPGKPFQEFIKAYNKPPVTPKDGAAQAIAMEVPKIQPTTSIKPMQQ